VACNRELRVMPVRTQSGRVLIKSGRVSCTCCEESLDLDSFGFLSAGVCDCSTAICYNGNSPALVTLSGGVNLTNRTPNTNRVTLLGPIPHGPVFQANPDGSFQIVSYVNIVNEPSVMRITGIVGGGLTVRNQDVLPQFSFQEELVPATDDDYGCGACDPPRLGAFPVNFQFVLRPNSTLFTFPFSEIDCLPYFQLQVRKISSYTPPAP